MADIRKPRADFSDVTGGSFSDVTGGSSSTAPAPERVEAAQTYTVVKGDSLSKIARRLLGDASLWPRIFEANKSIIKDPDMIHPGQVLTIPAAGTTKRENL